MKIMIEKQKRTQDELTKILDENNYQFHIDNTTEIFDECFDGSELESLKKIGWYSLHIFDLEKKLTLLKAELIKQHYDFYELLMLMYSNIQENLKYRIESLQQSIDFDLTGFYNFDAVNYSSWLQSIQKHRNEIKKYHNEGGK